MTLTRIARGMTLLALTLTTAASAEDKKGSEPIKIGPVTYQVSSAWQRQARRNEMRVAQFGIPVAEGETGKAELVVFYFGGQGGGVRENIARWKGMFESVEGKEKVESFSAGTLKITTLDITGAYKDKPFPMAEDFTLRKDYRMLAAVVETPDDGPYFFRMVGPKKSIGAQAEAWTTMLKSAKIDG